jgi:hydroxymethylglutaryl-CoA lyase
MIKPIMNNKSLRLFDVTLRDGIQSIPKLYSFNDKKKILNDIINRRPKSIEIGSIVSPKILPQMNNSIELFKYAQEINKNVNNSIDFYMLVPSLKSLEIANFNNVNNLSFITSVSDSFQIKNTNKTLLETKIEIRNMMDNISSNPEKKVKLYISCINKCPIQGIIYMNKLLNEILYYYYTYEKLDEICLSDTCGSLTYLEFSQIIRELEKRNMNFNRFSLHLHNQNEKKNVKDIITYAIKKGIYRFDVSHMPELGGCSVTMKNMSGNLSYDQIYECYNKIK